MLTNRMAHIEEIRLVGNVPNKGAIDRYRVGLSLEQDGYWG